MRVFLGDVGHVADGVICSDEMDLDCVVPSHLSVSQLCKVISSDGQI